MARMLFPMIVASALAAGPVASDEIVDLLNSAIAAYEEGDVQYALDEIEAAKQQLNALKLDALSAYLPPAPEGWTREVDGDMSQVMGMFGGGVGAEATYRGDGKELSITLMADNAMVAQMGTLINSAGMMGLQLVRIERQRFAIQDNQMMALVANRILVQAEGADVATMTALLEQMDFAAMANFGL